MSEIHRHDLSDAALAIEHITRLLKSRMSGTGLRETQNSRDLNILIGLCQMRQRRGRGLDKVRM